MRGRNIEPAQVIDWIENTRLDDIIHDFSERLTKEIVDAINAELDEADLTAEGLENLGGPLE